MRFNSRKQNNDYYASPQDPRGSASNMLALLPRELRNRIYTFCLQGAYDNEVIVRRPALGQTDRFTHLIREPCGQYSYQWIEDPIAACLSKKSCGSTFAREMLECYYWTRAFKFAHHELCLLGPFLQTDDFGLGMIPAVYARRLQIEIQPLLFAFLLPDHRALEEQRCCRAIESLDSIQTSRTEIAIELDLTQGTLSDADYEQFFDAAAKFTAKVQSVVDGLKERGLRVTLIAAGSEIQNETWTTVSGSMTANSIALTPL